MWTKNKISATFVLLVFRCCMGVNSTAFRFEMLHPFYIRNLVFRLYNN